MRCTFFSQIAPDQRSNSFILENIPNKLFSIPAKDETPKNYSIFDPAKTYSISDTAEVQNRKQSQTGGLARLLVLKVNARVIITTIIHLLDRLSNEQI